MQGIFKKLLFAILIMNESVSHSAVDQILSNIFFQNPAELAITKQIQLLGGNVFITPALKFSGVTPLGAGKVKSKVGDNLPYLLANQRITDKFVIGVNATPSAYGHINWPIGSIVETASTTTKLLYYRFGMQFGYQILEDLAVGAGINVEYEKTAELDFVIPGMGNQINKISGENFVGDVGLYYRINHKNYLTAAVYSPINTFGKGTSHLGSTVVNDFELNITDAAVAYVGLQHTFSSKWDLTGKIYWSGWSIEKNITFINTTTRSFSAPAMWHDVWSFQLTTRYATTDKLALLGSVIYETNPVPLATNAIGYPLAASGGVAAGVDIALFKNFSTQIIYGYGAFIPDAIIANAKGTGTVAANFQSVLVQFVYKI